MNKQVIYNEREEAIVLSKALMDLLLRQKKPIRLITLYMFLYSTAKCQKTNQERVREAKKELKKL